MLALLLGSCLLQEPVPAPPPERCGALVDLRRLEIDLLAGMLAFSGDFEADPAPMGLISLRTPLPAASRLLGFDCDVLGLFLQAGVSRIDRDLTPLPPTPDGDVFLGAAGLELLLVPPETWQLRLQGGVSYADFGDVDGVDSGLGVLVGLHAGLSITKGVAITVLPQVHLASEDSLYSLSAGLSIRF